MINPHMQQALRLAEQGLGQVWPNPAVGCVLVKGNRVIGLGRTQKGGRPHAETQALAMAGQDAQGATLYVTLEPCAHHGKTPPCAEAIVAAGVTDVVIACSDPDPRVNGLGIRILKEAGIHVTLGMGEKEGLEINRGFFSRIQRKRPWVTLKVATTADGFIAPSANATSNPGTSTARHSDKAAKAPHWITGEAARAHGHGLRAQHDAILTGSGTVLADDPSLTCRLPGMEERSPLRVLLDRRGRVPASAKMFHDGGPEVWRLDPALKDSHEVLAHLAERGITRLLIEAGSALNGVFLHAGLIDEIYWYRAPVIFGTGLPAFGGESDWRGHIIHERPLGIDRLTVYRF